MDEAKGNIKSVAMSATNKIKDFVHPPPEDSKTDFLAVGAGLIVAGLLTWGIYKACKHFGPASLEDKIKENKEKMAKSRFPLLDKINENKKGMNHGKS